MRRITVLAAFAAAALTAAGLAVARTGADGTKAVAATFAATTVATSETRSCTGADGTYELTKATYTGTAASDTPALAGPAELKVHTVYNTTTQIGTVRGQLRVRDADGRALAKLWGVVKDGTLDGFVVGPAGHRRAALLGSLTASFTPARGFTAARIGGGDDGPSLAVLAGPPCRGALSASVRLNVRGTVTSTADGKLTVAPADGGAAVVCEVRATSGSTSGIAVGDRVEMRCVKVGEVFVVAKVKERGGS